MVAAAPSMKIQSPAVLTLAPVETQAVLPALAPAYSQAARNASFLAHFSAVALIMFFEMPPSMPIVVAVAAVMMELVWFKYQMSLPVTGTVFAVASVDRVD